MHTQTLNGNGPLHTREILHRIALPILLFLAVLTGVLLLSRWALLPQWTQVNIGGNLLGADEAEAYAAQLERDVEAREQSRLAIMLPMRDTEYAGLRDQRASLPELQELREQIQDAARRGSPEDTPDAVVIDSVAFNAIAKTLRINGNVGGVGPRSMTVLAYFTEVLHQVPFVAEVTPPTFERIEDPKAGFYSPFTITLRLNDGVNAHSDNR